MAKYYMNKNAQNNGDHEVHKEECFWMPKMENQLFLGEFYSCENAVKKAREIYYGADGCKHCIPNCHTR